jgi:hypothetical protein
MIQEGMALVRGIAVGVGMMYFLDPVAGRRRRAVIRDKAVRSLYDAEEFLEGAMEDLGNRARGLAAETISAMRKDPVSDQALHDRVRALMGRIVSHPRAVQVSVHAGQVTLSGPIFSDEAPKLMDSVAGMRGVTGLENRLETHNAPTDHPALQGAAMANEPTPEFLQHYWTDGPRLVACTAGCALAFKGARQGGIVGLAAALAGLALMGETMARTPKAEQSSRQPREPRHRRPQESASPAVPITPAPDEIPAQAA